jgi:hypothetical protein
VEPRVGSGDRQTRGCGRTTHAAALEAGNHGTPEPACDQHGPVAAKSAGVTLAPPSRWCACCAAPILFVVT